MRCAHRATCRSSVFGVGVAIVVLLSMTCGGGGSKSPTAPGGSQRIIGSGVLGQKSVPAGGVTAVEHDGIGSLVIEQGGAETLVIMAEDNILPYLDAQVVGSILRITNQPGISLQTTLPIEMQLGASMLDRVELRGVGDISCDRLTASGVKLSQTGVGNLRFQGLELESLLVTLSGVGSARTSGSATRQDVTVGGVEDYRGKGLASEVAEVRIRSLGSATVRVSDHLIARIDGSGCVYYYGNPIVEAEISGSGCVERVGN